MQGHFPETVTEVALWLVTEAKRCNIQLKSKQLFLLTLYFSYDPEPERHEGCSFAPPTASFRF